MKTYEVPDDAEVILQRIAHESNSTPGEVLSEAVAYFDVLFRANAKGKRIVITDGEESIWEELDMRLEPAPR